MTADMTGGLKRIPLRLAVTIRAQRGSTHEDVRDARVAEPACACTPHQSAAGGFSRAGAGSCLCAALDPADAAACDRQLLARASAARRSPCARACGAQRRTAGLDLADQIRSRRRSAGKLPHAARALSRKGIFARPGLVLRLRPAGVPAWLARRLVGPRPEPECDL